MNLDGLVSKMTSSIVEQQEAWLQNILDNSGMTITELAEGYTLEHSSMELVDSDYCQMSAIVTTRLVPKVRAEFVANSEGSDVR
jgi:hypothetical protein